MSSTGVPHKLAARFAAGEALATGWCGGLGSPLVAEAFARAGYDAVVLDQQHGLFDVDTTTAAITAVALAGVPSVVRIPVGGFAMASRMLDAGAAGIIAPMVNSAADAVAFARHVKFPPVGERSWGPHRALMLTGLEPHAYLHAANAGTVSFAMVETREALDALDAILAVDGIDAVLVGPSDLSIALTRGAVADSLSPEVDAALTHVAARCKAHGKVAAAFAPTPQRAQELVRRGYQFLAFGTDGMMLKAGAGAALAAFRAA